jgi:hypothetical protein
MPPTTAHQTDRNVTHNKITPLLHSDTLNFYILLFNHIPMTNLLIYWSVHHKGLIIPSDFHCGMWCVALYTESGMMVVGCGMWVGPESIVK